MEETVKNSSKKKIVAVDTLGNVTYSLIAGSILDYVTGLNLVGIITSRASATGINSVTGGIYGWGREKIFKLTNTTEKSGRIRKTLVDLVSFNALQVPIYATVVAIGSLVSEGHINLEKVENGARNLALISPFVGPTLGLYMDGIRRIFGVKAASEGAYKKNPSQ